MVLAYHEIVPERSPYLYSVTNATFESHLRLLGTRISTSKPDCRPVQITFDDGHLSQYQYALPLLEKFNLKATFFITAGWTGVRSEYMGRKQLRELISLGHQVQAHGWSHKMLNKCSPSELHEELQHSKTVLEDLLGLPVEAVSIPHGRWNDRVLEVCAHVGYKEVYTSEPHLGPVNRSRVCLIGRLMITRRMSSRVLEGKLKAKGRVVRLSRVTHVAKQTLKAVIGEKRYHKAWRLLAAKDTPFDPIRSEQPTRIFQLISSEGYYGAESMLVNLAKSLNTVNCENIVGVFRNSHNPHLEIADRAAQNGLQVQIIPCAGRTDWSAVKALTQAVYKNGVDIIHTHGSKANFYGALASASIGVPLIATYHIDWPDRGFRLHCYHILDRLILRRFRKVVAVSEPIQRSLLRFGVRRERVTTIANGIDLVPFVSAATNHKPDITNDARLVIGVVGRLTAQKGHRYLLQIAPQVLAQFPSTVFLFVGDGPERQRLQQMVVALGLQRSVIFAGHQSEMPAVYPSVDILVLPSVNEGMPMVLIEALAARRPIIASHVGDVPKLIQHGKTGLLVEPANPEALRAAIVELLMDPLLRSRLGLAGQRWACEHFSAESMAKQYRDIYDSITHNSSALPVDA